MTRHRPTGERRTQILNAARGCMLQHGYQAARVAEIAAAAGLSKGAVYFHFENKRALVQALVQREFDRSFAILEAALNNAAATIASIAEAFAEVFFTEPDSPSSRFSLLTGEIAVLDDELRAWMCTLHDGLLERLERLIVVWADLEGRVLPDPRSAAVIVKALTDGLHMAWGYGMPLDVTSIYPIVVLMIEAGLRAVAPPA
ncbi:MAG: AcrR family transcriptional regulator [Bradymonadia bacterium]|jgi:AcrR family transcriptional regulator